MTSKPTTPQEYIDNLPEDRKSVITALRNVFTDNLPSGFEECISYGMLGYVVPHTIYPKGYHCDKKLPLPFIAIASQKNYISVHHMGMYEGPLLDWFQTRWKEVSSKKLDMGKCCIRFKKSEDIPFELIGELASKMSPAQWIETYEGLLSSR